MKRLLAGLLLLVLLLFVANTAFAQSDVSLRKVTVSGRGAKIDGRGGVPLWWDGFFYGTYSGTSYDAFYMNYTGSGNKLFNWLVNGTPRFYMNRMGRMVLDGELRITGSSPYLNFGTYRGPNGYGFWDDGGTMKFKDSGGSWTDFTAIGSAALNDLDASNQLTLKWNEDAVSDYIFNFKVNSASRTLDLSGDLTTEGASLLDQDYTSDASPSWNGITLSGLTASRLMSTGGSKELASTDLFGWIAGSTNRVTLSDDGDGTVTFTTPQDTHTGANPTFAGANLDLINIGITASGEIDTDSGGLTLDSVGGTVFVDDNLDVTNHIAVGSSSTIASNIILRTDETDTRTSGFGYGQRTYYQLNPAGASSGTYFGNWNGTEITLGNAQNFSDIIWGAYNQAQHRGTGSVLAVIGNRGQAWSDNTGTVTYLTGVTGVAKNEEGDVTYAKAVQGEVTQSGTGGQIDDARAFTSYITNTTGTMIDVYGFYSKDGSGSAAITNLYGVYIETPTKGGTLNYSIYSVGGDNYLGGNLGLDDATPTEGILTINPGTATGIALSGNIDQASQKGITLTISADTDGDDSHGIQTTVNTGTGTLPDSGGINLRTAVGVYNDVSNSVNKSVTDWDWTEAVGTKNVLNASGTQSYVYGVYNDIQDVSGGDYGLAVGTYNYSYTNGDIGGPNQYLYGVGNWLGPAVIGDDAIVRGVSNQIYLSAISSGTVYGYGVYNDLIATWGDAGTGVGVVYGVLSSLRLEAGDIGYHLYATDGNDLSVGGTEYGLWIDLDDADVTNYSIYVADGSAESYFGGKIVMADLIATEYGTGSDSSVSWATAGNDHLIIGTKVNNAAYSGNIIITELADIATNYGHANVADPHLIIHSSDAATTTDYVEIYHDQTDGQIAVGGGDLKLSAAGNVLVIPTGNSLGLPAGDYVNWGATYGSTGYGIRDNSGNMEYKDSGGSWQDMAPPGVWTDGAGGYVYPTTTTNSVSVALGESYMQNGVTVFDIVQADYQILIGVGAGATLSAIADYNTYIGYNAGNANLNGGYSVIIGDKAAELGTAPSKSVFIGYMAGYDTTAAGNFNVYVGYQAAYSSTGNYNTVVGAATNGAATASGDRNTILGWEAGKVHTSMVSAVLIGAQAGELITSGNANILIGDDAGDTLTTGYGNIIIGYQADVSANNQNYSIAIGYQAQTTANNQMVVGSTFDAAELDDVYFGQGITDTSPQGVTIHASGGSGTNNAGGPLELAGGKGTGNAAAGDIIFQISDAEASGTTLQTLAEKARITRDGMTIGPGTKHDGFVIRKAAEVQTTDATQTVVDSITLLDENTYQVEAWVVGVKSDGTDRGSYHLACTVYRTGAGGATLQGSVTSVHTQESNASWDATFTVNSNNIRVSVTGVAATTIEWGTTVKLINMSN